MVESTSLYAGCCDCCGEYFNHVDDNGKVIWAAFDFTDEIQMLRMMRIAGWDIFSDQKKLYCPKCRKVGN